MKKFKRSIPALCILYVFFMLLCIFAEVTEQSAHFSPDYSKQDLETLLEKKDYTSLFFQTGLSPKSILASQTNLETFQSNFFYPAEIKCSANSIISKEESMLFQTNNPIIFASLEDGDILITSASHTFFWRNGHAALVTNASKGETLESAVLGENSSFQTVNKWRKYPNFVILRLKNTSKDLRSKIAQQASTLLYDIPYDFSVGILSKKEKAPFAINGTQCAHLVWEAFYLSGYDIDADKGQIVTPNDLLESNFLEVIQIYGVNPSEYLPKIIF